VVGFITRYDLLPDVLASRFSGLPPLTVDSRGNGSGLTHRRGGRRPMLRPSPSSMADGEDYSGHQPLVSPNSASQLV
jgi:hypothetical protein